MLILPLLDPPSYLTAPLDDGSANHRFHYPESPPARRFAWPSYRRPLPFPRDQLDPKTTDRSGPSISAGSGALAKSASLTPRI